MDRRNVSKVIITLLYLFLLVVLPQESVVSAPLRVDVSGHITKDTTWTANYIYVIVDHVTVDANVTLTIRPGTIVKFEGNKLLAINGSLIVGKSNTNSIENTGYYPHIDSQSFPFKIFLPVIFKPAPITIPPVYFTSIKDDSLGGDTNGDGSATAPQPGDWGHIGFLDSSVDAESLIENAVIQYGGFFDPYYTEYYGTSANKYGVIRFEGSSPTIRNNTIQHNVGYALTGDVNSYPVVNNNTIRDNDGNGLEVREGTISTNLPATRYWRNTDIVYAITGHVTIPSGITLVIEPGVIVKFDTNKLMGVNGVLKVQGTSGIPVNITSLKDDTLGGDTNGDGSASAPQAGDWGHIAFLDSSVDAESLIENAVIQYGGFFDPYYTEYYGTSANKYGVIRFEGSSPTIQNNTIQHNVGYALTGDVNSYPVVNNNTIKDNDGNGLEVREGTISTDLPVTRYWRNTDIVYAVTGHVTIPSGITLVIEPGVTIKFDTNKLMGVNGVLKVQGTSGIPVNITSLKDDTLGGDTNGDGSASAPQPGDWGHINFRDSSVDAESLIEHGVIQYGGFFDPYYTEYYGTSANKYGVIRFEGSSPTIQNNTIQHNVGYALTGDVNAYPVVSNNTIRDNDGNGLEVREGTISTDLPVTRYWRNTDIVYAVTGHVTIPSGITLVIEPGVIVKFDTNKLMGVSGVLKVMGNSTNPVNITSLKDDTLGGDTNGDGSASAPQAGDWGHIAFLDSSVDAECLIENAVIQYGGFFDPYYTEYYGTSGNKYGVIRFDGSSPTIRNNIVTKNSIGLNARTGSQPVVVNNAILNNDEFGLKNEDNTIIINAENNWWGASGGPYHPTSNPSGTGNAVSDYVDFSPWLTSSPVPIP